MHGFFLILEHFSPVFDIFFQNQSLSFSGILAGGKKLIPRQGFISSWAFSAKSRWRSPFDEDLSLRPERRYEASNIINLLK
jgi:hypothetical protein